MGSVWFKRSRRVLPALVLSLVIAGEALAISWSPVKLVAEGSVYAGFLNRAVAVGGSTAHVAYDNAAGAVLYKRGTTLGNSWGTAQTIQSASATVFFFTQGVAAYGNTVVVAFEGYNFSTSLVSVYVKRSLDGGVTWQPRQTIGSYTSEDGPASGAVAASSGVIVAGWTDPTTNSVYIRRSINGGTSWIARQKVGTTTHDPIGAGFSDGYVGVSATASRVHVTWIPSLAADDFSGSALVIRRSTDAGANFVAQQTVDSRDLDPYNAPAITTYGTGLLATYALLDGRIVTAYSGDGGATFTKTTIATPNDTYFYFPGDVFLGANGLARVTVNRTHLGTFEDRVLIRESVNGGSTWAAFTTAIGAVPETKYESAVVATATYTLVVSDAYPGDEPNLELHSRRGTELTSIHSGS